MERGRREGKSLDHLPSRLWPLSEAPEGTGSLSQLLCTQAPGLLAFSLATFLTHWPIHFPPVHPSKVSDSDKSELINDTMWQNYGTPGVTGNLTLSWNSSQLPESKVNIELWGYQETGKVRLERVRPSMGSWI